MKMLQSYSSTNGFRFLMKIQQIVPAPGTSHSIIDIFQQYQHYLTFIFIASIANFSTPSFTILIFIICFFLICCRTQVSRERYLSFLSFANPYAIIISIYHKEEYNPSLYESCFKNKNFLLYLVGLYSLGFCVLNLGGIGLQCREIYLNQHNLSKFYDLHSQLVIQIEKDAKESSHKNNCKINPLDDKPNPQYIFSPYCEVTAEQFLESLEQDKKFYDGYVLQNDFTTKNVICVIVLFSYGIYSGLTTVYSLITKNLCGSCVVGYHTFENGQYIPYTVYARRKQIVPICQEEII
ncbi:transmembrane protein, putative (macronuclear) [Tetrahymena thermophila SB210]|uniref:Transmembrane protein, putative n=1 Tax=Tetrahymena thermophila (strain SB210) TaxID=312017 RepID=Q23ZH5_TETTS|nr:transmembrane protein, putative [Tetrahymena thermophila SB210]EAS01882.2 transmembrane protein, putative [Tetrahymena thermophila SB210]|eukprot:XP_001022127.2 transmembrane protein, putative [Tetrahymena thermophila SB210]